LAAATIFKAKHTGKDFLKKYNISAVNKPYLLYVGEIQPRKNIDTILLAFDALPAAMRKSLQLIIIGSARSSENMLKFTTTLKNLSNSHEIYHLTNVPSEDLVQFYNGALCFIFPSFFVRIRITGYRSNELWMSGYYIKHLISHRSCGRCSNNSRSQQQGRITRSNDGYDRARLTARIVSPKRTRTLQSISWAQTAAATMFGYRKIAR